MKYKLGLKPSLNFKMHFGDYVDLQALPPIPDEIDWSTGVPLKGTMFGNDTYGDCFWAAAAKVLMVQSANAGDMLEFTTDDVLAGYKLTGFDPTDPNSDQGTEPTAGFKLLQTVGIKGQKFGPALAIAPTRIDLVMAALHIGGPLMVGMKFFQEWENAQTWAIESSDDIGGHEIPVMKASRANGIYIETWGEGTFRFIPWDSLARNATQLTVCINPQFFANGQAPNGLAIDDINADAAAISGG